MRRIFYAFVLSVSVVTWTGSEARSQQELEPFAPFDARTFEPAEARLLQSALMITGDYDGPLDGAWSGDSQRALEAYAARDFDEAALNVHAAALYIGFAETLARDGWQARFLPELAVSFALPQALLGAPRKSADGWRWDSVSGGLSVRALGQTAEEASLWHGLARGANARPETLRVLRTPDLRVTRGESLAGRRFFLRSDRTDAGWTTLSIAADPFEAPALELIGASIRPGAPVAWDLPQGRLAALVAATRALLDPLEPPSDPPPPESIRRPGAGEMLGSGTGFYLGDRILVTAEHVVAGCARVSLRNGTPLRVLASDAELDVAALAAPAPAPAWLALAGTGDLRLGQPVHALGFPYYALAGTALNLTSGNVSALAGIDDDARFFSFTAPVQPGNSGGPLLGAGGAVMGVVVARLSEDFIAEATGTVPQNVNYALGSADLLAFLERSGVVPGAGGLGFDMGQGAPAEIADAIVPIICE